MIYIHIYIYVCDVVDDDDDDGDDDVDDDDVGGADDDVGDDDDEEPIYLYSLDFFFTKFNGRLRIF